MSMIEKARRQSSRAGRPQQSPKAGKRRGPTRSGRVPAMLMLMLFTGFAFPPVAQAVIPQSERDVLLALYASTNGDGWTDNSGWNDAPGTECSWLGIECDFEETHVLSIALPVNNLTGSFPALGNLTYLQTLMVFGNEIGGELPDLGGLTDLSYFNVGINTLSGRVCNLNCVAASW